MNLWISITMTGDTVILRIYDNDGEKDEPPLISLPVNSKGGQMLWEAPPFLPIAGSIVGISMYSRAQEPPNASNDK